MNAPNKLPVKAQKAKPRIDLFRAKHAICTALNKAKFLLERLGLLATAQPDGPERYKICCLWHKDTTPSLEVKENPETGFVGGYCFPCGRWVSTIDLVGAVRLGLLDLRGENFRRAIEEGALVAGIDLSKYELTKGRPRKLLPEEVRGEIWTIRERSLPLASVPAGRTEPWWHDEVQDYLRRRALPPERLDKIRLRKGDGPESRIASCLAADVTAIGGKVIGAVSRRDGTWDQTGHRLLVPMYVKGGRIAGLIGRATDGTADPKSVGTTGAPPAGTAMANCPGLAALTDRDRLTELWSKLRETRPQLPEYPRAYLCEGEMDFLTVALYVAESATEDAIVLGYKSGTWDATLAGCIPTGSEVYLLAHSDETGCGYRDEIAKTLAGRKIWVRHVGAPTEKKNPDENDRLVADTAGYSPSAGCVPYEAPAAPEPDPKGAKELSVADQLLALVSDRDPGLLIDIASGEPYLQVVDGPLTQAVPASGAGARTWVEGVWDDASPERVVAPSAVDAVLNKLATRATRKGARANIYRRVGRSSTGPVYLDLGNLGSEAVEITSLKWQVVDKPCCSFERPQTLQPLARPVKVRDEDKSGVWAQYFELVRVPKVRQPQVVGVFLSWLLPTGPYPLVVLGGEHGTAKTTAARMLRASIDPTGAESSLRPKDEDSLAVAARHSHLIDLDNLSSVPAWLSDMLCILSTGGTVSKRKLFTDDTRKVIALQRPVILTGITDLATRGDLLDRSITIELEPIDPLARKTKAEVDAAWYRIAGQVLGILCDGLVAYLRNGPAQLAEKPRLADFYALAEAGIEACGYPAGSVIAGYEETQRERQLKTLEGRLYTTLQDLLDPDLMPDTGDEGSPSSPEWFGRFEDLLSEAASRARTYEIARLPRDGSGVEAWYRRHAQALRLAGIYAERRGARTARGQIWRFWRGAPPVLGNAPASAPAAA